METIHFQLTEGADMSTSFVTDPIKIDRFKGAGIQAVWATGSTPVGTFYVQFSCDEGERLVDGTIQGIVNWSTVPRSATLAGGGAGDQFWDMWTIARYVRVKYVRVSGSSTVDIRVHCKEE